MARKKATKMRDGRLAAIGAAARLRELIFTRDSGTFLGSEGDVAELLGVGRATVRQTARLLEGEQLLEVRRGVGGGYYVSRPNIDTVTNAATTYLADKKADVEEVFHIAGILFEEIARRASLSKDQSARAELTRIHRVLMSDDPIEAGDLASVERDLYDCLSKMANAPFVELMLRVNTRFYLSTGTKIMVGSDRIRSHKISRAKVVEAILAQDEELTLLYARRSNSLGAGWLAEETAKRRARRS